MKPIADVVNAISGVINGLTLPAREKKELQAEILRLVYEREREMIEARAGVIRAEAAGNWLQRSWRPLVMLIFAVIVLIDRKSTRLNSSHLGISYAVFCLKKKAWRNI